LDDDILGSMGCSICMALERRVVIEGKGLVSSRIGLFFFCNWELRSRRAGEANNKTLTWSWNATWRVWSCRGLVGDKRLRILFNGRTLIISIVDDDEGSTTIDGTVVAVVVISFVT